jgi:ribose 5-phosphate isomerase B
MVYFGADHRGYKLKSEIKGWLEEWGYDAVDMGNSKYDTEDDYTDFAIKVAEKVALDRGKGILICASGIGMAIAANKVKGVRAGLCTSKKQARLAREDDDINVLCLSADLVSSVRNKGIVKAYLETVFSSSEKHVRRIQKIKQYEKS